MPKHTISSFFLLQREIISILRELWCFADNRPSRNEDILEKWKKFQISLIVAFLLPKRRAKAMWRVWCFIFVVFFAVVVVAFSYTDQIFRWFLAHFSCSSLCRSSHSLLPSLNGLRIPLHRSFHTSLNIEFILWMCFVGVVAKSCVCCCCNLTRVVALGG